MCRPVPFFPPDVAAASGLCTVAPGPNPGAGNPAPRASTEEGPRAVEGATPRGRREEFAIRRGRRYPLLFDGGTDMRRLTLLDEGHEPEASKP